MTSIQLMALFASASSEGSCPASRSGHQAHHMSTIMVHISTRLANCHANCSIGNDCSCNRCRSHMRHREEASTGNRRRSTCIPARSGTCRQCNTLYLRPSRNLDLELGRMRRLGKLGPRCSRLTRQSARPAGRMEARQPSSQAAQHGQGEPSFTMRYQRDRVGCVISVMAVAVFTTFARMHS